MEVKSLPFICKWILSVLNKTLSRTISSLESYEFLDATTSFFAWWQYEPCDTFLEAIKPYFFESSLLRSAKHILWICLDNGLCLLHHFMPFVLEELWQRLPQHIGEKDLIMISNYPSVVAEWTNEEVENEMDAVKTNIVKPIRLLRLKLSSNQRNGKLIAYVLSRDHDTTKIIETTEFDILILASLSALKILHESDPAPRGCESSQVNKNVIIYLGTLNPKDDHQQHIYAGQFLCNCIL